MKDGSFVRRGRRRGMVETFTDPDITLYRGFLSTAEQDSLFAASTEHLDFHIVEYDSSKRLGDNRHRVTPCYTNFYGGCPDLPDYQSLPPFLRDLKERVELSLDTEFNAVLTRLYMEKSKIAWHTDGRSFLGDQPIIASLSLGASTSFVLRRLHDVWDNATIDRDREAVEIRLDGGDLLVMHGDTQKHWQHCVPSEKGRGPRFNFNFRYILPAKMEVGHHTFYKYMVHGGSERFRNYRFRDILLRDRPLDAFFSRPSSALCSR